ncbi:hypothetical protein BH10PSE2_BH10PSE2_00500 [soil metagenome]
MTTAKTTRYLAHAHGSGRRGHLVEARSFEDAALTFSEVHAVHVADEDAVRIIVQAEDGGPEHCFVVHLDDGGVEACG